MKLFMFVWLIALWHTVDTQFLSRKFGVYNIVDGFGNYRKNPKHTDKQTRCPHTSVQSTKTNHSFFLIVEIGKLKVTQDDKNEDKAWDTRKKK